jgi:hypothetical protein
MPNSCWPQGQVYQEQKGADSPSLKDNNRRQDFRLLVTTALMLPYWGLLWWALVALVGNPLCLGREEHTICETEVKLEISV